MEKKKIHVPKYIWKKIVEYRDDTCKQITNKRKKCGFNNRFYYIDKSNRKHMKDCFDYCMTDPKTCNEWLIKLLLKIFTPEVITLEEKKIFDVNRIRLIVYKDNGVKDIVVFKFDTYAPDTVDITFNSTISTLKNNFTRTKTINLKKINSIVICNMCKELQKIFCNKENILRLKYPSHVEILSEETKINKVILDIDTAFMIRKSFDFNGITFDRKNVDEIKQNLADDYLLYFPTIFYVSDQRKLQDEFIDIFKSFYISQDYTDLQETMRSFHRRGMDFNFIYNYSYNGVYLHEYISFFQKLAKMYSYTEDNNILESMRIILYEFKTNIDPMIIYKVISITVYGHSLKPLILSGDVLYLLSKYGFTKYYIDKGDMIIIDDSFAKGQIKMILPSIKGDKEKDKLIRIYNELFLRGKYDLHKENKEEKKA